MDADDNQEGNQRRSYTIVSIVKLMVDDAQEHETLVRIATQIVENEMRDTFDEANYNISDNPPVGFSAKVESVSLLEKKDIN